MKRLREKARSRLRGASLSLTTPFSTDGNLDENGFRRNIEFYISNGMRVLMVGGIYGEVTALTQEERKRVIRVAVDQSRGRAVVVADTHHVGSLAEAISLTRYAEETGADYAYILTPYLWRLGIVSCSNSINALRNQLISD